MQSWRGGPGRAGGLSAPLGLRPHPPEDICGPKKPQPGACPTRRARLALAGRRAGEPKRRGDGRVSIAMRPSGRRRIGRGWIAGLALLALAACDALPLPETGIRAMAMYDGSVTARSPEGYCIDSRTSRPETGFAVMGGCALLSRLAIMPQVEALITVQFGATGSASVEGAERDLVALLRSARGAALLSSSGVPEGVLVEGIETGPGVVLVRFTDTAPPIAAGLERTEWRAFLDVAGRLTTITVRGFERAPLDRDRGLALMTDAVRQIRGANPG